MFCTYDWLPSLDINDVTPVQNFDPFLKMVTSSMKQLTILSAGMVIQQWHLYTSSLMIKPWIVLELSRKFVPISFKHEYRRPILSSLCDVIRDVISMRNIFMPNLHMVFPFLMSNWSYIEQVKKWRNFEVWANFFVKSVILRKLS